jgi:hypothetical protein
MVNSDISLALVFLTLVDAHTPVTNLSIPAISDFEFDL